MFSKQWGRQFLIRIALRDESGGIEPPAHQVAAIFADRVASKSYADKHRVTEQQVMNAFLSGKEVSKDFLRVPSLGKGFLTLVSRGYASPA